VGVLKLLAVLIAALGMAAVESRVKDDDDVALFVGSAHPLLAKRPINRRPR
jgi:hypothetical protein